MATICKCGLDRDPYEVLTLQNSALQHHIATLRRRLEDLAKGANFCPNCSCQFCSTERTNRKALATNRRGTNAFSRV
jgi:hypothetical protein